MPDQIERSGDLGGFGPSLLELSNRWRRAIDAELRPLGLSQATWRTLVFVSRAGNGYLQKDLAYRLGIEGPSLVPLLDALEERRLIERRVAPSDRRGKTIHLTSAGKKTIRGIQTIADQVQNSLLKDISAEDLRTCLGVFDTIRVNNAPAAQSPEKKTHAA
ncbi:MAG: MarR family transcriptional regulator [Rhodospirillaceae bacterium]|jgi:MarR family transcriptional regulator for hemolysin|nr:MarR family transcriptional regulator [Rhodospirillaceae bacterium]MBT3883685.1 MarR family transcriptional regulator [Rhodospirillaceae bacterium]MBT4117143.1 MarR family transcriptional regulator [Rhodospirillaceae bacterium]MBT4672828.1 MarR family transcriptional regulator [Rhodospirillaceae bacterium]MBT4718962.1 MarR family transcriptional regulator [Rhodospirillaceae bacterium]